jgi:hypothetical protein
MPNNPAARFLPSADRPDSSATSGMGRLRKMCGGSVLERLKPSKNGRQDKVFPFVNRCKLSASIGASEFVQAFKQF